MKIIIAFLLIGSVALTAAAQDKEPFLTRTFNESIKNVQVKTSGGNITVAGGSGSEAKVEMFVYGRNLSKEELQKRLDENYEINISVANNQLTAIAKQKPGIKNWNNGLGISFKVYVPQNVATDLATSGGNIRLSNLSGNQTFRTSGGNLDVDQLSGNINGRTSGGNITVKNANNSIDLATSGGNINANNCSGTLKIKTSGGSLTLDNLKGNISARTSGGSIKGSGINGELSAHTSGGSVQLENFSGSLETSTSGGSIHADVKELGKYITISNSGGNIDLALPDNKGLDLKLHASKISMATVKNFSGSKDDNEMNGTINGGGIPVTVKASSGRLNLAIR
jgi:DUF4097 and DUF4098 domain-containing protein YvlB